MKIIASTNAKAVERLLTPAADRDRKTSAAAAKIVSAVRARGDAALLTYARRFDRLDGDLEVSRDEIEELAVRVPPKVRAAIAAAAKNIEKVARRQRPQGWTMKTAPGVTVEQRVTPLDRVGCYVPGGRYPLPSSLLMTAIPARAAGVREIIVACPRPAPVVMAAARAAGVTRLFRMGGAQAIAAMAYGTKTVPRVDKIVGPGNQYVAAAKALVATDCAIDFYAGPTEIVIVSDKGNPEWIAADLIAQAEHDPQARAVLITTSRQLALKVARAVSAQMPSVGPGKRIARAPRRHHHRRQPRRSRGARQSRRPRSISCATTIGLRMRLARPGRFSSARTRRRSRATTRSARITCCRPMAPRGSAAACTPPISCACRRFSA